MPLPLEYAGGGGWSWDSSTDAGGTWPGLATHSLLWADASLHQIATQTQQLGWEAYFQIPFQIIRKITADPGTSTGTNT